MVETLRKEFAEYNLTYSIGGQISFDVFPQVRAPGEQLHGRSARRATPRSRATCLLGLPWHGRRVLHVARSGA